MTLIEFITAQAARLKEAGVSFGHGTTNAFDEAAWLVLWKLGLPLENRADDPEHGLAFDFLSDAVESHAQGVMTGHDNGLITLAVRPSGILGR